MKTVALSLFFLLYTTRASALTEIVVEDVFHRRINEHGLMLVDWEGQIANPAIQIFIQPPPDAGFPATAVLSSTEPRVYFDLPSDASATGPTKTLSFPDATTKVAVFVSIFPDRDTNDEDRPLTIAFTDHNGVKSSQTINVHVIDQDKAVPAAYEVTVDFSKDQTGFYNDAAKRDLVRQAAQDWSYFFADMNLDAVAAGAEETFIWNRDGFNSGTFIHNASAYRGFLLYTYGIDSATAPFRSGGEPSQTGGFQSSSGIALPLRRSGGTEIEIKGNYNTLGWFLTTTDSDWWKASNFANEQNDLISIAHHEIGHSLIFNPGYTRFGQFKNAGSVQDAQVLAYQGSYPSIDSSDHLNGSIDRLSKKGAFGYEYYGNMPARRWLITKLDLLVAQAIGYKLRQTSAFIPLQIVITSLPQGNVSSYYSQQINATGGIPAYDWSVISGALPDGLLLDPFSGAVSGRPGTVGTFNFTVSLRDNDSTTPAVTQSLSIRVENAAAATPTPTGTPGLVGNVSTRLPVGTGDNVLIEGFIVQGPVGSVKKIIVRATGPTLVPFGITDALANPTLEIHDSNSATIAMNNDWKNTQTGGLITGDQSAEIAASGLAPSNDLESAIIANLAPGSYTAVVQGAGGTTGTGVVDAYDLSGSSPARLANIATRGLVQPGDQLMIAGFIIQNGPVPVVVRAIGPSLVAFGINNALADTTLQLRDQNGVVVVENDNWKVRSDGSSQQAELEATGLQPGNDLEAAFATTLQAGQYTAQLRGKPETTGIGVVQVYFLQ